jgi:caffeoyl-CoA O-methyltransferase
MIDEKIQDYANRYSSPQGELLTELSELTDRERADRKMLSGAYQGRVLAMISHLVRPRRVLEIGTFVGFSALCFAEGLADGGKIITLDMQPETHSVALEFFARSPYADRIDARLGDASDIIPTLDETFDLVFIDADKPNYLNYFNLVFPRLRIGGLIVADNVLWSGGVLAAEKGREDDESTVALHEFNRVILADERVSNVLLTIRDGLMIIRKEAE